MGVSMGAVMREPGAGRPSRLPQEGLHRAHLLEPVALHATDVCTCRPGRQGLLQHRARPPACGGERGQRRPL